MGLRLRFGVTSTRSLQLVTLVCSACCLRHTMNIMSLATKFDYSGDLTLANGAIDCPIHNPEVLVA